MFPRAFTFYLLFLLLPISAFADSATSTSFIIESGVTDSGGGAATSTSFNLQTSIGQSAVEFSTSTSFRLQGGFATFPAGTVAPGSSPSPPPSPSPPTLGSSGSFGSGTTQATAQILVKGTAYPGSRVTLLRDGQQIGTATLDSRGTFEFSVANLPVGTYTFGIWAEDRAGTRSLTHTFTITLSSGATTVVSGIFLPPTISLDRGEVRRGEILTIVGQSAPGAAVSIILNSGSGNVRQTMVDLLGIWVYKLDTSNLPYGTYSVKARAAKDGATSPFSQEISFIVGDKTALAPQPVACSALIGDINKDCRVNLVDFSIAASWWKRAGFPSSVDLNLDGKFNLVDFSILVFYWTG